VHTPFSRTTVRPCPGLLAALLLWHDRPVAIADLPDLTELADFLRDAFAWGGEVGVAPGPRGALGRIWRVESDTGRYALKEIFFDPPAAAVIEAEVVLVRRAAAAGVRAPASHPDRLGHHLLRGPGGTCLRLFDWVSARPVDPASRRTPGQVGELLARLHRSTRHASTEPDGSTPDRWYDSVPSEDEFAPALDSGAPWVPRLAARLALLPELRGIVKPVDPARTLLCHRDLHPGNVLADEAGALVVFDWDNVGPADPARELAKALFDWWSDPALDAYAMRAAYVSYLRSGGPARITSPDDFAMLVAEGHNFLRKQLSVLLDDSALAEHRAWAEQEIDESLRIMPTPGQLAEVLDLLARIA
jgi:Ser/Thr protein kinase RdoA (MazF antagonist)